MKYALVVLCTALCGPAANAAVILNVTEDSTGWFANFAGTLDLSGLPLLGSGGISRQYLRYSEGSFFNIGVGNDLFNASRRYEITTGPGLPMEPGTWYQVGYNIGAGATGGGPMWELYLTTGGSSHLAVSNVDYFNNEFDGYFDGYTYWPGPAGGPHPYTFAETQIKEGRYVYGLANGETVTLNIGNAYAQPLPTAPQVPLPAGLPLLAGGVATLAWLRRRPTA